MLATPAQRPFPLNAPCPILKIVLEPLPAPPREPAIPRASLLAPGGELSAAAIWMGGAQTAHGVPIDLHSVTAAWVIDCAGDMPPAFRAGAARWFSRVFPDLDAVPPSLAAIRDLAREVADALLRNDSVPANLYVVCQHGMNRSGLVAGLVLRELGLQGAETVERIVTARPGSLSNQAFRHIVATGHGAPSL